MIKKSQIETLIICKDREFKHRAISLMNNIAFNAEKISVESGKEAVILINQNPKLLNIIIDGSAIPELIQGELEELKEICAKPNLMAVMGFDAKQKELSEINHGLENLVTTILPFEKNVFNDAFHNRGGKGGNMLSGGYQSVFQKPNFPSVGNQGQGADGSGDKKAANTVAFETSAHVKDTVAMINILSTNRGALEQVSKVGQIFNGIVGAYGYFSKKDGYKELRELADIVDTVCRQYEDFKKGDTISDEHFDILLNAAKGSYLILKELRANSEIPKDLIENAQQTIEKFKNSGSMKKKENISQSEVDDLLDSLQNEQKTEGE